MVGPVPIGFGFPTWYQVRVGVTTGPDGVHLYELLTVVQAVEFLPGTAIPIVPGKL